MVLFIFLSEGNRIWRKLRQQFVRRTKQWTPTVYRVGHTGGIPVGVTTQKVLLFFCNPKGLRTKRFDRLASDCKPLANESLPSPY